MENDFLSSFEAPEGSSEIPEAEQVSAPEETNTAPAAETADTDSPAETSADTVEKTEVETGTKEDPKPDEKGSRMVPYAAVRDARKKNRELAEQLAYLKGQLEAKAPPARGEGEPTTPADFYADPEAWTKAEAARIAAEAGRAAVESYRQEQWAARAERKTKEAEKKYGKEEFDAVQAEFRAMVATTPGLREKAIEADDIAEFAYGQVMFHRAMEEAGGSLEALTEKIRNDIQAEASGTPKETKSQPPKKGLPKSLANAQGSGNSRTGVATIEPDNLITNIFGGSP